MKKLIALLCLLLLIGCGKKVDNLVERNGVKFEIDSTTPYNGIYKSYYENGQLKTEENYKYGKLEGVAKAYDESGKPKMEINYKNGIREGVVKFYNKNGKLKTELNYKNGKIWGIYKQYSDNGQLELETMVN